MPAPRSLFAKHNQRTETESWATHGERLVAPDRIAARPRRSAADARPGWEFVLPYPYCQHRTFAPHRASRQTDSARPAAITVGEADVHPLEPGR